MIYPAVMLGLLVLTVSPVYWLIHHVADGQTAAFAFAFWSILFVTAVGISINYLQWRSDTDE